VPTVQASLAGRTPEQALDRVISSTTVPRT
jgi:hypothetical protein